MDRNNCVGGEGRWSSVRGRGGGVVGGRRVCDVTKPIKDATAKITCCQGQLQVDNRSRSSSSTERGEGGGEGRGEVDGEEGTGATATAAEGVAAAAAEIAAQSKRSLGESCNG